jgi:hypothetical protein
VHHDREVDMNKRMLTKSLWKPFTIWPPAQSVFANGRVLARHWPWRLTGLTDRALTLQNTTTGHVLPLPFDHVWEYRENIVGRPPFLILRSQVCITRADVFLKPILNWRPPQAGALAWVGEAIHQPGVSR